MGEEMSKEINKVEKAPKDQLDKRRSWEVAKCGSKIYPDQIVSTNNMLIFIFWYLFLKVIQE